MHINSLVILDRHVGRNGMIWYLARSEIGRMVAGYVQDGKTLIVCDTGPDKVMRPRWVEYYKSL